MWFSRAIVRMGDHHIGDYLGPSIDTHPEVDRTWGVEGVYCSFSRFYLLQDGCVDIGHKQHTVYGCCSRGIHRIPRIVPF